MRCGKGSSPLVYDLLLVIAVAALVPVTGRADQIVAITNRHGQIIYVNTNVPSNPPAVFPLSQASEGNPQIAKIDTLADRIAEQHRLDPRLVHAVIQVESNYDPTAVSDKGAMGLMQLIPQTAARFGVSNPFSPRQNIEGGVTYLKYLMNLFHGNLKLALAAYNAGENSVVRWGGIPPIAETQNYVQKVTQLYRPKGIRSGRPKKPSGPHVSTAPIIRYVDSEGVVHFTNTE
jgi:soluble lytic murein transglycosylase-like protein